MISVTINGVSVAYKPGIVWKDRLSDELDEGLIIIPQSAELDIEPLDQVVISDTSWTTKYALISNIKRTITDFISPKKYNYEISLTSPTIQLQRILLPNRSITQWVVGTRKSVYTVMSQYLAVYAPTFSLSSALTTLGNTLTCAEFQWNRPTLFEVFNDLLSEAGCVVTMTDFTTISYRSIDAVGSDIGIANLTDEVQNQSIEDYASAIELEAQNSVIKYKNTNTINWVAAKNSTEATTTTQNMQIPLEKDAYQIKSFKIAFEDYTVDATPYILEKSQYDLLRTNNTTGTITGDYKRCHVYFTEGNNVIDGLSYDETTWIGTTSYPAIVNVWKNAYYDTYGTSYSLPSPITDFYLDFLYYVEYISIETVKFESQKDVIPDHASKLVNNQDTSYVDIMQLSKKQHAIVNSFANPSLQLNGKYLNYYNLPDLGDIYATDYKLVERTLVLYNDFTLFSGLVVKDFVNPFVYTGLKSRKRYTQIASSKDSFECIHNNIVSGGISHDAHSDYYGFGAWLAKMGKADNLCKLAYVITHYADATTSTDIAVAVSSYPLSDSIVCEFKMYDNQAAGIQLLSTDVWTTASLVKYLGSNYVKYVDSHGEFVKYDLKLYSYLNNPNMNVTNWATAIAEAREYPEINPTRLLNRIYFKNDIYRYKDNREIMVETVQFHVRPESGIFTGEKFYIDSAALHQDQTADTTLFVAYSTSASQVYTKADHEDAKGTIASSADLTYTITTNHIQIVVPGGSSVSWIAVTSYAICDSSGNVYIAVNGNDADLYIYGS